MKSYFRAMLLAVALLFPGTLVAQTDNYPSRSIQMTVAFTAGGTTDIIARLVGKKMTEAWGQPVVIDNRPGAGGNLGSALVAKAPPDGYTLLIAVDRTLVDPATLMYPNMPYDHSATLHRSACSPRSRRCSTPSVVPTTRSRT